jgi:DNA polymerase-3 subunit gamma/tau
MMKGEVAPALARLKELYDVGADPVVVLEELAAFTHLVTRLKLAPNAEDDAALTEEEKTRGKAFATDVSLRVLARTWQMLLKGIEEAKEAARPLAAADMVIVRIAHAADLPTPDEALKALGDGGGAAPARGGAGAPTRPAPAGPRMAMAAGGGGRPAPQSQAAPEITPRATAAETPRLQTFADLVALVGAQRELKLKHALETTIRPVRFEPPQIEIALTEHAAPGLVNELARKLEQWTGQRWVIAVARDGGAMTIDEVRKQARAQLVADAKADPLVAAVMARFPGAEIVDVRLRGEEPAPAAVSEEGATGDDNFEDISLDDNFEPEI